MENSTKSSFAGFLDGFRAGNLETTDSLVRSHLLQLCSAARKVSEAIKERNKTGDKSLIELFSKFEHLGELANAYLGPTQFDQIGEIALAAVSMYRSSTLSRDSTLEPLVQNTVYWLVSLAESLNDPTVQRLAINAGESFQREESL